MNRTEFSLRPSPLFFVGFSFLYVGAIVIMAVIPVSPIIKIIGIMFLLTHFRQIYGVYIKRCFKLAITRIWQDSKGNWGFETRDGRIALGKLTGQSFKSPWLIILSLRLKKRIIYIPIPKDALNYRENRVLRCLLTIH